MKEGDTVRIKPTPLYRFLGIAGKAGLIVRVIKPAVWGGKKQFLVHLTDRERVFYGDELEGSLMTNCNFQFRDYKCNRGAVKEGKCFWHAHIDKNPENLEQNYPQYTNLKQKLTAEKGEKQLVGFYLKRANLEGADLEGVNLSGANLKEANLWGANLKESNLEEVNLSEVNLKGANLERANLERANLWGADLKGASLQRASLEGANLSGADLWTANLEGADLWRASLWQAKLELANLKLANLEGANLQEALNLSVGQLSKVKTLYGAKLDSALMEQIKKDYPHLLGEERRRFPREPVSVEVGVRHSGWPLTKVRSLDITVRGIRLFLPEELPKDKVMELEINVPLLPIITRGKVVWINKVETKEGKFFQAGMEFTEIKQTDKARIETFTRNGSWYF